MITKEQVYKSWRATQKSKVIDKVGKLITGRRGYTCKHAERQFDDDICDSCLFVMIVEIFDESLKKLDVPGIGEKGKLESQTSTHPVLK